MFSGASSKRSGEWNPTSSFALDRFNREPRDIATDGSLFWVVNDTASVDSVFRYGADGKLQGSWTVISTNKTPTGIAVDNANPSNIWIADAGTDRVYKYEAGAERTIGQNSASSSFPLNTQDKDPQGIAIKVAVAPTRAILSPIFDTVKPALQTQSYLLSNETLLHATVSSPAANSTPISTHDSALNGLLNSDDELNELDFSDSSQEFSNWFSDLEGAISDIAKVKLTRRRI